MVLVNGTNLNQLLIREGYAWVYRKYCRMDVCDSWYWDENKATPVKDLWRAPNPTPWNGARLNEQEMTHHQPTFKNICSQRTQRLQ